MNWKKFFCKTFPRRNNETRKQIYICGESFNNGHNNISWGDKHFKPL